MRTPLLRVAVSGVSMLPTFAPGDFLLVWRTRRCHVGDIVVVRRPQPPALLLVKRCARVDADGGLWVVGDNAEAGERADDSRAFGGIRRELVVGRVVARYWPWRRRLR